MDGEYEKGKRVQLFGIESDISLNGMIGKVVDFRSGRYGIRVEGRPGPGIRVRASCVMEAPEDATSPNSEAQDELAMSLMSANELADAMLLDNTQPGALDEAIDRQLRRVEMLRASQERRGLPVAEYKKGDREAFQRDLHDAIQSAGAKLL